MKRLSTIRNILLLCATVLLGSCDLTETMQVEADKSMVFGSESGLRLYAYSFYRHCLHFLRAISRMRCVILPLYGRRMCLFSKMRTIRKQLPAGHGEPCGTSIILSTVATQRSVQWMQLPAIITWVSPVGSAPGFIMTS